MSIEPPGDEVRALGVASHVTKPFRRSQLDRALEPALVAAAEGSEARI